MTNKKRLERAIIATKLHLSYPSKLNGAPSIGTTPRESCPVQGGSCRTCYAALGMARMPHVAKLLANNTAVMRNASSALDLADIMLQAIPADAPYFRWYWSGDCPTQQAASAIHYVAQARPNTIFWVSTRTSFFDPLFRLDNLIIRKSVADFHMHPDIGETCVLLPGEDCPSDVWACPGQCGECRVCWTHPDARIGYRWHGSASAGTRLASMIRKGEV